MIYEHQKDYQVIGFLFCLSVVAFFAAWYFGKEFIASRLTRRVRAADVAALAPGTRVKVGGTIRCAESLTAELSGQACVFHETAIERRDTVRDDDGKAEERWVQDRRDTRLVPFEIEDESGRVLVDPEGASIEGATVHDREDPAGPASAEEASAPAPRRRYKERALASDGPGYVLGYVRQGGSIGASPGVGSGLFFVTHETEQERERSSRNWTLGLLILGLVSAALTVWFWIVLSARWTSG